MAKHYSNKLHLPEGKIAKLLSKNQQETRK